MLAGGQLKETRIEWSIKDALSEFNKEILPSEMATDYIVSWVLNFIKVGNNEQRQHPTERSGEDLLAQLVEETLKDSINFYYISLIHIGRLMKVSLLAMDNIENALRFDNLTQTAALNIEALEDAIGKRVKRETLNDAYGYVLQQAQKYHGSVYNSAKQWWKTWKLEVEELRNAIESANIYYRAANDQSFTRKEAYYHITVSLLSETYENKQLDYLLKEAGIDVTPPDAKGPEVKYVNLGIALQDLGDYAGARALLEKGVDLTQRKYGHEHPATAIPYSNLGILLREMGDYARARTLLTKAVDLAEENLGPNHSSTALTYTNLAMVLQNMGDYTKARELLEKAVNFDEKHFGPNHPTTAIGYSNLASVLQDLGDYDRARDLLEKAVDSAEKNFGPKHLTTAMLYSNLATLFQKVGDNASALFLLAKTLDVHENNLGPDHTTTAMTYSNLAIVLHNLGDYASAFEFSKKSLSILEKMMPEGHSYINRAQKIHDGIRAKL